MSESSPSVPASISTAANVPVARAHFIRQIIQEDLATGRCAGVITRFPPEPNGYLHIGHAKSICLNFGLALEFNGRCHLRMDDTNPTKEDVEYVESIKEDIRWLGFDWATHYYQASDYFEQMHACAVRLIEKGLAYVCHLSAEQMGVCRGTPTEPAKPSPWRDRPIAENLAEFAKMRTGFYTEGTATLRAKIDLASPNMHMRDPVLYRIRKISHHNTGDKWCIYPMYDFAHPLEDAFEGVSHSICTLEFEVHRPFYDWIITHADTPSKPRQYEFARLNLTYSLMSKRKLYELVRENHVSGWDDPRMPTLCGFRRRGYTPASIRKFCETIGVTKFNSLTDVALLEHAVREDLNKTSSRVMVVLDPLRVIIENYPSEKEEWLDAVNNPEDPAAGTRKIPFSREIFIERDDFKEDAPKKFFRLSPGREIRLRWAYFITCTGVEKDASGNIIAIRCTYDPATRGGDAPDGRKVKSTIHWVSTSHAIPLETRLYDRLFSKEDLNDESDGKDWREHLNPNSLKIVTAHAEPSLAKIAPGTRLQFERIGYFVADIRDSKPDAPVFNRTVSLKDSWEKINKNSLKKAQDDASAGEKL
ncbi:MAG: glutamine--tRNA ligase/YqeY domain fusion protein [Puniceicoccales bacterium]|jgi:glutaminyl-tRNA synthetase|nr:glutamine--tRNA ligase/YqeY domain fusion protein [Puniceicoccales bacterium]